MSAPGPIQLQLLPESTRTYRHRGERGASTPALVLERDDGFEIIKHQKALGLVDLLKS